MENSFGKMMVIDGSYMLHRCMRAKNLAELTNLKGEKTGGVFGFLRSLSFELKQHGEFYPIVCWDEGLSKRRTDIDENYKKFKEKEDKSKSIIIEETIDIEYVREYRRQRNQLIILLSYIGIPSIKFIGVEGDDIMKTITEMSEESIILTDDADMIQLLSENCHIRRPMKDEYLNYKEYLTSSNMNNIYEFTVKKALLGDESDNIPSAIKGVGKSYIKDYIKVIYMFYDGNKFNLDNYPQDEDTMKALCEKAQTKYRKVYLNLDRVRFFNNLELVDLNLVHLEQEYIDSIIATVSGISRYVNYFSAMKAVSDLDIREQNVSIDDIIDSLNKRKKNIWRT